MLAGACRAVDSVLSRVKIFFLSFSFLPTALEESRVPSTWKEFDSSHDAERPSAIQTNIQPNTKMKANIQKKRRGFTLVELLVVIVIIAALAGLSVPQLIKMRKRADYAEAVNNAKQLGLALTMFESDYGSYPDDSTSLRVAGTVFVAASLTGANSNAYFRQLFAGGTVDSEQPFYAKTSFTKTKPDDAFTTPAEALKAGECGFGYIMQNATTAITVSGSRPVALTPCVAGDTAAKMELDSFDGKAVVLFADNSARSLTISRDTAQTPKFANGKNLLAIGADTVWGAITAAPVVKPPAAAP